MLATARIPGATGMPAYKQGHQQEKEYHQQQKRQQQRDASSTRHANSNRKAMQRLSASKGKASGSESQWQLWQTTEQLDGFSNSRTTKTAGRHQEQDASNSKDPCNCRDPFTCYSMNASFSRNSSNIKSETENRDLQQACKQLLRFS
jgi:hypothetical protein